MSLLLFINLLQPGETDRVRSQLLIRVALAFGNNGRLEDSLEELVLREMVIDLEGGWDVVEV